jgi:outer membrane protein
MNKINVLRSFAVTVILLFSYSTDAECQVQISLRGKPNTDSLALRDIIKQVITTHPTVKVAEEAINNADSRIGLARTGYNPEVDLTGSYSNIGPVTKLSIPDMGTFQLFPENNYSAAVSVRQVFYDWGRTRQNIKYENQTKAIGEQTLEQVKQKLSFVAVNYFYTLLFLQSAIKIKEEQLVALNEHLTQVIKMMETGSATEYQVLATKVRISGVESQRVDLIAALTAQQASMNSLIGADQSVNPIVRTELTSEPPVLPSDSLLSYALHNRDEVILNQERTSLAELRYGMVKLVNKPNLNLIASGGAKNGYVPNLGEIKANYVVGVGIRVPIFDGMKNKYNLEQARSVVTSLSYESEYTRRNVSNELIDAEVYMLASEKKVSQYNLQLEQALKAYSLAETSYRAGVITNLDLLDSNTSVSESRLLLLKAKIDYSASIYKLKAALGERLY